MVDSEPVNTPVSTTVVSAMSINGPVAWDIWPGGTTKERFIKCVKDELAPSLPAGSIVAMDNLSVHHAREAEEILREHGIRVLCLPPYSPDFNPIEMMWSKMKEILRKWRTHTKEALLHAADEILQYMISPADCINRFKADGYFSGCTGLR